MVWHKSGGSFWHSPTLAFPISCSASLYSHGCSCAKLCPRGLCLLVNGYCFSNRSVSVSSVSILLLLLITENNIRITSVLVSGGSVQVYECMSGCMSTARVCNASRNHKLSAHDAPGFAARVSLCQPRADHAHDPGLTPSRVCAVFLYAGRTFRSRERSVRHESRFHVWRLCFFCCGCGHVCHMMCCIGSPRVYTHTNSRRFPPHAHARHE